MRLKRMHSFCMTLAIFYLMVGCKFKDNGYMSMAQQNTFLQNLFAEDQAWRNVMNRYSDSMVAALHLTDSVLKYDLINEAELKMYLVDYGIPDSTSFSEDARSAVWHVLQHVRDQESRRSNYKYVRAGFEAGIFDEGLLWLYLSRSYLFQFGDMHPVDNSFEQNHAERIPILEKALNLTTKSEGESKPQ